MTQVTEADREAAWPLRPSCYTDDQLTHEKWSAGVYDASAPSIRILARHREQAVQEAVAKLQAEIEEQARIVGVGGERELAFMAQVAERDARIEGLTIERDFHRETADLHAARIAALEAKLAAVKHAADGVLAPICEKVGRCLIEAPDMEAVKVMHDYGVELPFGRIAELYDATDYDTAALQEIDNAAG